jgi:hypothetical protein
MVDGWWFEPRRCTACGKLRVDDLDVLIEPDAGLCFDCLCECEAGSRCWDCLCSPCECGEIGQLDAVITPDKASYGVQ